MISSTDQIVTVFTEPASGPGWANSPLCVIVRDENGELRKEYLQPEEQTKDMRILYATAATIHGALMCAVERMRKKRS